MSKPCKWCESREHTAFYCRRKPVKPLKRTVLSKTGKHYRLWSNTREQWYREHPADQYECYICTRILQKHETYLDHIKSRVRHPELRYVLSNLAPICSPCNRNKGSRDLEEI